MHDLYPVRDMLKLDLSTFQMFLHIISVMNEWLTLHISRQDICYLHIVCITTIFHIRMAPLPSPHVTVEHGTLGLFLIDTTFTLVRD